MNTARKPQPKHQQSKLASTQLHDVLERAVDFCEQHGIAFIASYQDAAYRVHTFQHLAKDYPEAFHHALQELGKDV